MRILPLLLAMAALSCAPFCRADGIGTLMQVGSSMDDAEKTLAKETAQYEKVKAGFDGGEIKKGLPKDAVMKKYGTPQVAFKDSLTKRDKWVYKPGSSNYFEGEKIYIFFDGQGLIDEAQLVKK